MGRPINKRFIGNISGTGQQLQATAFFGGESEPKVAYINKQVATNTYEMTAVDGSARGRVQLTQGGVDLQPGEANVLVTPYGSSGAGVVANARMGVDVSTPNVAVGGGLNVGIDYNVGDKLTPAGGTYTQQANLTVTSVQVKYVSMSGTNAGQDYDIGNYIEFGGAGWISNLRVAVSNVDVSGAITEFAHVVGAGYLGIRNAAVPADPLSGGVTYTGSGSDNNGTGATFNVQWGVYSAAVNTAGNYSVLPGTTNVSTTTNSATGTGATVDLTYKVTNVAVANGGSDFDLAATVNFDSGAAAAVATVNAAGSISGISVTANGTGYTSIPGVSVDPVNGVQYAAEIRNRTVWTFDNNTFEWIMSNEDIVESNQARIQSA